MKKYVTFVLIMLLTGCQTLTGAHVSTYPTHENIVVSENQQESELDRALPAILAESEKHSTASTLPPDISSHGLPEAIDEDIVESSQFSDDDIRCLANNIYHESRGEPEKGQIAVAWVTVNRVNSGRYRPTVCGVVYQRSRKGCQFSWVCDRISDTPRDQTAYRRAMTLAKLVLTGEVPNPIGQRLSFHATSYRGYGSGYQRSRHLVLGRHLFY